MKLDLTHSELQALTRAFERWGDQKQVGMAMEECAETITALNHFERGRVPIRKIIEEFADAFVCVAQVLHVKGDDGLVQLEAAIADALGKLNAKLERSDHNYVAGREAEEPKPVGTQLNHHAYEQLIEEDIAALPSDMPRLERDHIIVVLRDSVTRIYGRSQETEEPES